MDELLGNNTQELDNNEASPDDSAKQLRRQSMRQCDTNKSVDQIDWNDLKEESDKKEDIENKEEFKSQN